MCEATGSLPNAGGLFDQDPKHIELLHRVIATREKVKEEMQKDMESRNRVNAKADHLGR